MNPAVTPFMLVLFLGGVWTQESGEGALEDGAGTFPDLGIDECSDSEETLAPQLGPACTNETKGIPLSIPKECGGDRSCRYLLFQCGQSFDNAQYTCRRNGGQLASIHNSWTNSYLQSLIRGQNCRIGDVWIGVQKTCRSYQYTCVDGSPLDYTNWDCGQPNMCGRQCVTLNIRTGKWRTANCNTGVYFICRV